MVGWNCVCGERWKRKGEENGINAKESKKKKAFI